MINFDKTEKPAVSKSLLIIFGSFMLSLALFFVGNFFLISSAAEQMIVIDSSNPDDVVKELGEQGILNSGFDAALAKVFLKINKVEPGGYLLKKNQGAFSLYSHLMNPDYVYVEFPGGLRKEQVVKKISEQLKWTPEEKKDFLSLYPICSVSFGEGFYFPDKYLLPKNATPTSVSRAMKNRFDEKYYGILKSLGLEESPIDLNKAVTIASLIEREAGGKNDMRLISGVIKNRLEKNMPLQIDATLQYSKGNENKWWPRVRPSDKYIKSDYNTYKNTGLPPAPIANPSEAALAAAISPLNTDCLYYIHDSKRVIHCAATYEEHLKNIKKYLK